jgi:hypothetical protein
VRLHPLALLALAAAACGPKNDAPAVNVAPPPAPPPAPAVVYAPRTLAAGQALTLSRVADGGVIAWGNAWGAALPVPLQGPGKPLAGVVELAAGGGACARLEGGAVRCWMRTDRGAKEGDVRDLPDLRAEALAGRDGRYCVRAAGAVSCWIQQLGGSVPPSREEGLDDARDLAVGDDFICATRAEGAVLCWGSNEHVVRAAPAAAEKGQPETKSEAPRAVPSIASPRSIAAGASHACAILADETVACWGSREAGQLDGTVGDDARKPLPVPGLTAVKALALGAHHSCALTAAGRVVCWGAQYRGQLGVPTRAFAKGPTVVPGLEGVTEIAAGDEHTCARRADGAVLCWGTNTEQELGIASRAYRHEPVLSGRQLEGPKSAAKPDPACPAGRVHVDDLARWVAEVGAADEDKRAKLLDQIGLDALPSDSWPGAGRACAHEDTLSASVDDAQLTDAGPPWKIVYLRYRACGAVVDDVQGVLGNGVTETITLAVNTVLRPLGGGDYCPVKSDAGTGVLVGNGCGVELHPMDEDPGTLTLVDLVSAKHKSLRFETSPGTCDTMRIHEATAEVTFLDACERDGLPALCRVLALDTLYDARHNDTFAAGLRSELTISDKGFPRTVTFQTLRSCETTADGAGEACKEKPEKKTFVYKAGIYLDPKEKPKPKPAKKKR